MNTYANKVVIRGSLLWITFVLLGIYLFRTDMFQFALCLWAGHFKAVMDTLQFHFTTSIFADKNKDEWYNPLISWMNKYSDPIKLIRKKWFGFIPVPVFLKSHWHLSQFFMLLCLFGSMAYIGYYKPAINWWADALICRSLFGLNFNVYYSWLFKK